MVDYSTAAWIKIILALVIAFVISFIATPLVKNFAVKVGAIDIPDKKRHIHSHPIPRMGGLAIFLGFLLSSILFGKLVGFIVMVCLAAVGIISIYVKQRSGLHSKKRHRGIYFFYKMYER